MNKHSYAVAMSRMMGVLPLVLMGFFTICSTFVMMAASSTDAVAQTADIRGTVRDKATGEPLFGASARIDGTAKGSATDADGAYAILWLDAGSYVLVVSYLGYVSQEIPVQLAAGESRVLDVDLVWDNLEGEEVLVTAQVQGQIAAINQQRQANTITNIVSKNRIEELPDVNAAESPGRPDAQIPFASLFVRGSQGAVWAAFQAPGPVGYSLRLRQDGVWSLWHSEAEIMSGLVDMPAQGWIGLRLAARQDVISGFIDGVRIFEIRDSRYAMGHVGIGSSFHPVAFDDLRIRDAHGDAHRDASSSIP